MDLVATVPKTRWDDWLAEGDCAGTPTTGAVYAWVTSSPVARYCRTGDRLYIVAHGKLRGWAVIGQVERFILALPRPAQYEINRAGGAVACTIPTAIPGFPGLRKRWWDRKLEVPFPDWRTP